MMSYQLALLLSAISTNGVHGYLLLSQKEKRRFTISEHAVLHKKSFILYVLGHILGGAFFLIFARQYYVNTVDLEWLFSLSVFTVSLEYAQALIPARGRTNTLHTVLALAMWLSIIILGILSIIFVPAMAFRKILASLVFVGIFSALIIASSDRKRIYKYQMIMVTLFYLSIFVLVI